MHREIIEEWQSTAEYLFTHLDRSQAQLHFICDVEDEETAAHIIEPFVRHRVGTPLLAACRIRLGRHPDTSLSELAQKAAVLAAGMLYRSPQSLRIQPFRFLDLPPEIRQHILTFTDLVTPLREVEWARVHQNRASSGYCVEYMDCECRERRFCHPEAHNAFRFQRCYDRFCHRFHATYCSDPGKITREDQRCRCWVPPPALFLVSHAMCNDAIQVFFKHNRFVVLPDHKECHQSIPTTPNRLPASIFIADILAPQKYALRSLRFLEIVFPPFGDAERNGLDFAPEESSAYQDWVRTIDLAKDQLSLPALTLKICFADYLPTYNDYPMECFRFTVMPEDAESMIASYYRIVKPLSRLQGLDRVFAHTAWPMLWCEKNYDGQMDREEWEIEQARETDEACEELVMGKNYSASSRGKREVRKSLWMNHYHGMREWI